MPYLVLIGSGSFFLVMIYLSALEFIKDNKSIKHKDELIYEMQNKIESLEKTVKLNNSVIKEMKSVLDNPILKSKIDYPKFTAVPMQAVDEDETNNNNRMFRIF